MSEMVEQVARAIFNASIKNAGRSIEWSDDWPDERIKSEAMLCARAAIEAMPAPPDILHPKIGPQIFVTDGIEQSKDAPRVVSFSRGALEHIWGALHDLNRAATLADKEPSDV